MRIRFVVLDKIYCVLSSVIEHNYMADRFKNLILVGIGIKLLENLEVLHFTLFTIITVTRELNSNAC